MTGRSSLKMKRRGDFDLFLKGTIWIVVVLLLTTVCMGGEFHESEHFLSFIRSVDPQNLLGSQRNDFSRNPCLHKPEDVKCNLQGTSIVEIRLENLNLSGVIDADALCKLRNLQVLSLARNRIHGNIPSSISYCTRLRYLNLSSNALSGRLPRSLVKMKYLKRLDISNNHFTSIRPHIKWEEFKHVHRYSKEPNALQRDSQLDKTRLLDEQAPKSSSKPEDNSNNLLSTLLPMVLSISFLFVFLYYMKRRADKKKKEKEMLKALKESPLKLPPVSAIAEVKPDDRHQELVFFVQEESFKLDDLLEASADLRSQGICSSLYKVILKNNATYAVKRLKKLRVSVEECSQILRQIGNLRHRNILPLLGYNCTTNDDRLLFYKYQTNGSLLNLLQDYVEGKREFPWRIRLSIASGIARGLAFIYQRWNGQESIPHGNLKPSNILLGENMEPLISEYGISTILDPKHHSLFSSNGYTAPEKSLSEQGDVYSFGVILLELLTGKTVEKTGVDLPKWVRSMVREEWTGEVFDKEVTKTALQWAFPLLNIALKCVSYSPQDRPTTAEVLEKIEEALFSHQDRSVSSISSCESGHPDCCILHSVIPETWDTPGSNY